MSAQPWHAGAPGVIAHRGASAAAPENTMAAITAAWACGAPWIELDVQLSRDDVPVIIHDEDLDRTTNGSGAVRDTLAADIAHLDAGSWFDIGSNCDFRGAAVPTLSAALSTLDAGRRMLLEIKGHHTRRQVQLVLDTVRASHWEHHVLLQSFEVDVLQHIKAIDKARPVGLLVDQLDPDPVARCQELGAVLYNPHYRQLTKNRDVVTRLQHAGIGLFPWTVDERADWQYLTDLGVQGIITNRPANLLRWQASRAAGTPA